MKPRSGASGERNNTATATTATADRKAARGPGPHSREAPAGESAPQYIGRFAPSPTGRLHLGSLLAATGSFLDARSHGGLWRVRMEDLDRERALDGGADNILRTLEAFALQWDGPVEYQSRRTAHYLDALQRLQAAGATFECSCSRRELASESVDGAPTGAYPGTCRSGPRRPGPTATRFMIGPAGGAFEDRFQGHIALPAHVLGDVIVRRRDGVFAYQLAVVVDDALQGMTDIVRGADLLDSTAWQMALQQALGLPTPRYGHLPLLTEAGGAKLAKSRHAAALDPGRAAEQLLTVLTLLNQSPPEALAGTPPADVLDWALAHWNPQAFHGIREIAR